MGVSHNKDYSILGSILGSPYLGKVPYCFFVDSITINHVQQDLLSEAGALGVEWEHSLHCVCPVKVPTWMILNRG